jgi:hypothetical protein
MVLQVCKGVTKAGGPCKNLGRYTGFCKIHKPCSDCPICYEPINKKDSKITACKHEFHKTCLEKWLETKHTCPICRYALKEEVRTAHGVGQILTTEQISQFLQEHVHTNWTPGSALALIPHRSQNRQPTLIVALEDVGHWGVRYTLF